jgi:hypothetical protein
MKTNAYRAKQVASLTALGLAAKHKAGHPQASESPSMDEPRLQDMLQDPILLRLMTSDNVEPRDLVTLLDDTRAKLFD